MAFAQELKDISRQIRNLSKKQRRAAAPSRRGRRACVRGERHPAHHPRSLAVYVLARHSSSVAVDFMSGRGWRHCQSGKSFDPPSQSRVQESTEEVEQAFLQAPISGLVALVQDPLKHFEFEDLLCAHKYVMEHRLFSWIKVQNQEKGVAPSREQICNQALDFISAEAPNQVRCHLSALLRGSPRKQRKWLARFRKRWGAKLGVLRPRDDVPLALRKLKASKQKTFHAHFKTSFNNIIRPDPILGPQYGKALLLDMFPRPDGPSFWSVFFWPCRLRRISSG